MPRSGCTRNFPKGATGESVFIVLAWGIVYRYKTLSYETTIKIHLREVLIISLYNKILIIGSLTVMFSLDFCLLP